MSPTATFDLPIYSADSNATRRTYRVNAEGQLYRLVSARDGRNQPQYKRLRPMLLAELIRSLAAGANSLSRAIRDKFPHQVVPGVWQLRFAVDHHPPAWLHGTTLEEFLRRHAIGPDRVQPPSWKQWPPEVTAVASALEPSTCRTWFLISGACSHSDSAMASLVDQGAANDPLFRTRTHCPFIVLGPVAFCAIRHNRTESNRLAG
jgi:hypothetical protein